MSIQQIVNRKRTSQYNAHQRIIAAIKKNNASIGKFRYENDSWTLYDSFMPVKQNIIKYKLSDSDVFGERDFLTFVKVNMSRITVWDEYERWAVYKDGLWQCMQLLPSGMVKRVGIMNDDYFLLWLNDG